ncbi:SH3 domain-containing protein [Oscillospiraceae bacterium 50-60]
MKKALIYALALALALSLTACGQPKAEQPTDPAPGTSAPEPIATPEPIKDTAPEPEPEQTPAAPVETEDTQPPEETESQEDEVQLFTEVNETVYATGTVNLRSGPSTAHDKVGSLNKSDSVTRVGIGTADAEGWSRIQLSDGSIVYVSNKYLSTTKPVVQQQQTSKPSGGQQSKPNESTQQQQTQQTETPPSDDGWVDPMQQLKDLESQGLVTSGSDNNYSDADKEILGQLLNGG